MGVTTSPSTLKAVRLAALVLSLLARPANAFHLSPSLRLFKRTPSLFLTTENNNPSQQSKEYLATCVPGLAPCLQDELIACGAVDTQVLGNAAVSFAVDNDDTVPLKALLWTRTAHRLLEKMDEFYNIQSREDVYDAVQDSSMHVKDLLGDGKGGLLSLSVKVIANGRLPKDISHSHYTALTIKNALVDQVRAMKEGDRPNVELVDPDVPLVAIFHATSMGATADMTLYRSLAPPGSLHRRGYRAGGAIHKAAMKESMAAGLLLAAGWDEAVRNLKTKVDNKAGDDEGLTLVDPMCGSGSLLLEAAMMTVDFAPGLMRLMNHVPGSQMPPVLRWKGNENSLAIWKELLLEASQSAKQGLSWMKDNHGTIALMGNDIHAGALELVDYSLKKAGGLDRIVELHQNDCCEWNLLQKKEHENHHIYVLTNPPWGVRLTDDDHESWESLRTFLRSNCPPGRTQAWVLSGNKSATKHLGLRRSQSLPLKTGQQDLRWIQYIMLERKEKSVEDSDETKSGKQQPSYPRNVEPERRIIRTRSVAALKSQSTREQQRPRKAPRRQTASTSDKEGWV